MTNLRAEDLMEQSPLAVLQDCGLVDFSDLARVGFRGMQSAEYLQKRGFELPERPNQAVVQTDGSYVARLSATEYLILGSLQDRGQRIADEEARWELDHQANYLLPRHDSHAWLQLSGVHIAEIMAKLCGVDLRTQAFKPGDVVQTSAARINVIIINVGLDNVPCFQILCDRASQEYFADAVLDAMAEFGGKVLSFKTIMH
ncbi:hypothetical protein PS943_04336 [Pseudomonas fluorescens]|uniref:Uncharacterized protein n=1 Tax=Pseudomonas fluorescens TaxID=294 RepID=A0A5E7WKW8_PSEFL|nr:sarcosine oxidase [Pseudomonas fluorescens]VVQ35446.1 hypothetical protein PS943_04336 [Pseudomonas fluorescens]